MHTLTVTHKTTTNPDLGGFRFYVTDGESFDAVNYAEAYGLNYHDIDPESIKAVQNAAASLNPCQWLEVTHETDDDEQDSSGTAFGQNIKHYGSVEHDGRILALTQQAYADNASTDGGVRYRASAIDQQGNVYRVEWETTPEWDAVEEAYRADPDNNEAPSDESDACDWSSPVSIVQVG